VAVKDWRLFWADRRGAAVAFLVPFLLASIFGMVFHRPGGGLSHARLPLAIVNEDDDPFTQQLVADLLASPQLDAIVVERCAAETLLERHRVSVVLILPEGLGRLGTWHGLLTMSRPTIDLWHQPMSGVESQWAEGVFTEIIMRRLTGATPASGDGRPFGLRRASVPDMGDRPFDAYAHSFCGMTLQYLLFWGMDSGLMLLRERQRGVWRRYRSAPVSLWALLAGKAGATAAIALLQVLTTFGLGWLIFGVTVAGSITALVALAAAAALLASATGLLVAAVGGAESRARSVSVLVILSISMLGGLWVPTFLLPGWVRSLALALPTTWAMHGLDGVTWQGQGWSLAGPCVLAVLAFAGILLIAAGVALVRAESAARRGDGV
jgi:ABC-2 type transport system permease protein